MELNINSLLNQIKGKSCARYINRKGIRIKAEDYEIMDPQDKESLEMPTGISIWTDVDDRLNELNQLWDKEPNKLKRKHLELQYDLLVETTAGDDPERIKTIKQQLFDLERQLEAL